MSTPHCTGCALNGVLSTTSASPPLDPEFYRKFLGDLLTERARQRSMHPKSVRESRPHLNRWERYTQYCRLLTEELGEVANAIEKSEGQICKACEGTGRGLSVVEVRCMMCGGDGRTQAPMSVDEVRKEAVQVAALVMRMLEEEGL